jgi:hypothetical protein
MGFAKYHEDNMEMWEERNQNRQIPIYVSSSQSGANISMRNRIAEISAQGMTVQYSGSAVSRTIPHRF